MLAEIIGGQGFGQRQREGGSSLPLAGITCPADRERDWGRANTRKTQTVQLSLAQNIMGGWARGEISLERGGRLSARASPTLIRAENEIFEPAISAANSITPAACTKSCSFLGPEIEKRRVLMRWWITGSALIADRWESLRRVPKLKASHWISLQRGLWKY